MVVWFSAREGCLAWRTRRAEVPTAEREVYIVPLASWAEGWPELAALIDPLVDQRPRNATDRVLRIREMDAVRDLLLAERGYRPDVYWNRAADRMLVTALEQHRAAVIIGKPASGKTRMAWEVLQAWPEAVVVAPKEGSPPEFEPAGLSGNSLVLLVDNLHERAPTARPVEWWSFRY